MIYTEEDLQQAYAMGYNEAVDDVDEYLSESSMEFSLDSDYAAYDEDYSAVEDMIFSETKTANKEKHDKIIKKRHDELEAKLGNDTGRCHRYWNKLSDKERFDYDVIDPAIRHHVFSYGQPNAHLKVRQDPRLNHEPTERQKRIEELKKKNY